MIRRLIGGDINLAISLGNEVGEVMADRGQMEKVVMNLVTHAREVMPQGGMLRLEIANVDMDKPVTEGNPGVAPGEYFLLAATYDAAESLHETPAQPWEPSLAPRDGSTGASAGLSTLHRLVNQSGGHLSMTCKTGKPGLKIYLPRVERSDKAARTVEIAKADHRHTVAILLVQDEPGIKRHAESASEMGKPRASVESAGGLLNA